MTTHGQDHDSARQQGTASNVEARPAHERFFPEGESTSSHSFDHSHMEAVPHRRSMSWQSHLGEPQNLRSTGHFTPPLSFSCPPSPSPSPLSRASSSSSRRPLPSPPTDQPPFVPFRSPPHPPSIVASSVASREPACEEKRELARMRGLDDLLERDGESDEDDRVSPTLSDLPEYEGREGSPGEVEGRGKDRLGARVDEELERREQDKARTELDEVRTRVNQEAIRIVEEDQLFGKERLIAQRREEEVERHQREEARSEAERGKRARVLEAQQDPVDSPPPPLSPSSRNDLLPLGLGYSKEVQRPALAPHPDSLGRPNSCSRLQYALPPPPPVTTYTTPIPFDTSSPYHVRSEFESTPSLPVLHSRTIQPAPSSFYATPSPPVFDTRNIVSSAALSQRVPNQRQGSIGPASSFYSASLGLPVERLQLHDYRSNRGPSLPTTTISSQFRIESSDGPAAATYEPRASGKTPPLPLPSVSHPSPSPPPLDQHGHFPPSAISRVQPVTPLTSDTGRSSLLAPRESTSPSAKRQGVEPAFYHSVGGQLLPFYPASTPSLDGPQTFYSPASVRSQAQTVVSPGLSPPRPPLNSLSPPPTPHQLFPSLSTATQRSASPLSTDRREASPDPLSLAASSAGPLGRPRRASRMSTIKHLLGRKGGKGQDEAESRAGQRYIVREE